MRIVFRERAARGNFKLRGTDNVQGQTFACTYFRANRGYSVYYPSKIFQCALKDITNSLLFSAWSVSFFSSFPFVSAGSAISKLSCSKTHH